MNRLLFLLLIPFVAGAQILQPNPLVVRADTGTAGSFLMLQRNYFSGSRPSDSYFEGFGIHPIVVVYQNEFGCPPTEALTRAASTAHQEGGYHHMIALNDECVSIDGLDYFIVGEATATANMLKMAQTVRWFKSQTPGLVVADYSYVPELVNRHWKGPGNYYAAAYQAINNHNQPLADAMDYLAPSIYSTYTDTATMAWKIRTMVGEAVRLAKGKPVYPFISPQYYQVADSVDKLVSYSYWKRVLQTVQAAGASGAILFVWHDETYTPVWDSTAGWWTATKEFLASRPSRSSTVFSRRVLLRKPCNSCHKRISDADLDGQ